MSKRQFKLFKEALRHMEVGQTLCFSTIEEDIIIEIKSKTKKPKINHIGCKAQEGFFVVIDETLEVPCKI